MSNISDILLIKNNNSNKEANVKNIIQNMLEKNVTLLDKMQTSLIQIFKDNKIDATDVPYLVNLLKDILTFIKDNKFESNNIIMLSCDILSYTTELLITNNLLNIDNNCKEVCLTQLNGLIYTCFDTIDEIKQFNIVKEEVCELLENINDIKEVSENIIDNITDDISEEVTKIKRIKKIKKGFLKLFRKNKNNKTVLNRK